MKTFIKSGKKFLSVFMAIMMIMTAWVFVDPAKLTASAQSAGSYNIRVTYSSDSNLEENFGGTIGTEYNDSMGIVVNYRRNNGTGTEAGTYFNLKGKNLSGTKEATIDGFPTMIYLYFDDNRAALVGGTGTATCTKLEVKGTGQSTWTTLWTGTLQVKSVYNPYACSVDFNGNTKVDYFGDDSDCKVTGSSGSWASKFPAASTFTWQAPNTVTCPATNSSTSTTTSRVTAKDQYGVNMFDPTWSVSGNVKTDGISAAPATAESTTVSVKYQANIAGTTNSQTGTLKASWTTPAGTKSSSKTFTINDAQYTATFTNIRNAAYEKQADQKVTGIYYGCTPTAVTTAELASYGDNDYHFTGWTPAVSNGMTADTTYTAIYDEEFIPADYTVVTEAIAAATAKKADSHYIDHNTPASRTAVDEAINGVVYGLGRTAQGTVNDFAKAINDAVAALTPNKYIVTFKDEAGTVVGFVSNVECCSDVTAPATLKKAPTADYHYENPQVDANELKNITSNKDIIVTFDQVAHEMERQSVTANCLHGSGESDICSVCGFEKIISADSTLGAHTKSDLYMIDTEPTCTETGSGHYYCTVCLEDLTDTVTIPAKGHSYTAEVTTPATCSTEGVLTYTCSDCGDTKTEAIPTVAHDYAAGDEVAATCTTPAYRIMKCKTCDDAYTVYSGSALGHSYAVETISHGTATLKCSVCDNETDVSGIDAQAGHNYNNIFVTKEPTCKETGTANISCEDGDVTIEGVVLPVVATAHKYTSEYVPATCEAEGSLRVYCELCNTEVETIEIAKTSHSYTYERTEPTCTEDGKIEGVCENCGAVKATETIPATNHKIVTLPAIEATCYADGKTAGAVCSVCDEVITEQTVIGTTGHAWGTEEKSVQPTCTQDGYSYVECTKCDAQQITATLNATNHDYETTTVPSTCVALGYTKDVCKNCGDTVITMNTELADHTWSAWATSSEATCAVAGVESRECSVCGKIENRTTDLAEHSYVNTTVEPDCFSGGYTVHVCSVCNSTYIDSETPKNDHIFGEWIDVVAPTCLGNGTQKAVCTACGFEKLQTVDPIGHIMAGTDTEATCFTDSYTTYTCQRPDCGHNYIVEHPGTKIPHTFVLVDHQSASCEVTGFEKYQCSVCGYEYTDEKAATGHNWNSWETVKAPTCSDEGVAKRVCKNNADHVETTSIPASGNHVYKDTVVAPTCTQQGYTIHACKECGVATRILFVQPKGHEYTSVHTDATCTEDGGTTYTCPNCTETEKGHSYFEKDADALGHDWSEYKIVAHPTVANAYAKLKTCNRAGCSAAEYETATGSTADKTDSTINQYFKVQFVNDFVTGGWVTATDGTKLADETKYKAEFIQTSYVLKGEQAVYEGKTPVRDNTYAYGKYDFKGWTVDADQSLDVVTSNTVAHAKFEGVVVKHLVLFYNYSGSVITGSQYVEHGKGATAPLNKPTRPNNNFMKFEFDHWDTDFSAIYSQKSITAIYNQIPMTFKIVYHDYNGKTLASEVFKYGDYPTANPTELNRPQDNYNIYAFSGKWKLEDGTFYSMNVLTAPSMKWNEYDPANEFNEDLTEEEKGIIHVYADYYNKIKIYRVRVIVVDSDGDPVPGAVIQILNETGAFYDVVTTDSRSEAILELPYASHYTLQITDSGEVTSQVITLDERNLNENFPSIHIMLQRPDDYYEGGNTSCSCMSHTPLIGRIYIFFLNLIYRLTGRKIVCCEDMYAVHGDQLVYKESY